MRFCNEKLHGSWEKQVIREGIVAEPNRQVPVVEELCQVYC